MSRKALWHHRLAAAVGSLYTGIVSRALGAVHISVFVRDDVLLFLKDIRTTTRSLGACGGIIPNKGAILVSVTLGTQPTPQGRASLLSLRHTLRTSHPQDPQCQTLYEDIGRILSPTWSRPPARPHSVSLCFVVAHLAPHQDRAAARHRDIHRIFHPKTLSRLTRLPKPHTQSRNRVAPSDELHEGNASPPHPPTPTPTTPSPLDAWDFVFFFGDLNYRVQGTRGILDCVLAGHGGLTPSEIRTILLHNDQLDRAAREGDLAVFPHAEGEIFFPPTYKHHMSRVSGRGEGRRFRLLRKGAIGPSPPTAPAPDTGTHTLDPQGWGGVGARPAQPSHESDRQPRPPSPVPRTLLLPTDLVVEPLGLLGSSSGVRDPPPGFEGMCRVVFPKRIAVGVYDLSKKLRVPSWTDRVLFRAGVEIEAMAQRAGPGPRAVCVSPGDGDGPSRWRRSEPYASVVLHYYDSVPLPLMRCSDHRPVHAVFSVATFGPDGVCTLRKNDSQSHSPYDVIEGYLTNSLY